MGQASLIGVITAGLWLIGVGLLMAFRPGLALRLLRLTASTRTINNVEQGLRLLAGLALILRSPESKVPPIFGLAGWFIVLSSVALLVVPLRWHSAYATWWADRLSTTAVRLIAPISALAGASLIYAAL